METPPGPSAGSRAEALGALFLKAGG